MSPARVFDIVAVVCFAVAAIPWPPAPSPPYAFNLMSLGLVFFTLGHMFP